MAIIPLPTITHNFVTDTLGELMAVNGPSGHTTVGLHGFFALCYMLPCRIGWAAISSPQNPPSLYYPLKRQKRSVSPYSTPILKCDQATQTLFNNARPVRVPSDQQRLHKVARPDFANLWDMSRLQVIS